MYRSNEIVGIDQPTKINDRRDITCAMTRENLEASQNVENRANNLRSEALRSEIAAPRRAGR